LHDDTPDGESSSDDGLDYPGDFRATYLPLLGLIWKIKKNNLLVFFEIF
jgi:hypothetical protein